ncbi:hypothetical protein MBORA_17930 [Methanobrevibacter oralis]|uniref:Uncharacterized protein n=1 Tax=Methanobrevibacter oralis TaxID=66851 RepID=A0A165ZF52_METOA|nr:hypothetical protein MBORA_17930 [Methanobrevibacter oralis]
MVKFPEVRIADPNSAFPCVNVMFIKVTIESALIDLKIHVSPFPSSIVCPLLAPIIVKLPL